MDNHLNKYLQPHTCTLSETKTQCKSTATDAADALLAVFIRLIIESEPEG